ncbi:polysaccharide biosynthesis/export family protein [Leptolyngbya sp. PCC 6406]|uniref:polysaccharide biosynthesis/export family protein n=1 Tax=Leptolyngbya sp. PCC 6406 TaxID=1173264 RepID=UPI0002EB3B8E|nr:polysaccharide biosynthesis/export family protein [Leptolyngbya sp. PCC 6406]
MAPSSPPPPETAPLPAATPQPSPRLPGATTTPTPTPSPFSPLPGTAQTRDFDTYRLGPGDSFFVSVPRFPELSFQATLDIQGNIIVPLEGAVTFNGLTLAQAEARIAQIYDQYVVNPRVNITLVAQRGVQVTILGEVVRPGFYPLGAPQISTALLTAGGTTGRADLRAVRIQRQLFNGEYIENTIDLFTPLKEGFSLPDVALQDGDVIVVERLDPGQLDEYDQALVSRSTLAQAQIVIRVLNYGAGGGRGSALTTVALPNGSRFIDAIANGGVSPDSTNIGQIALIRFDEEAGQAVTTILDGGAAFRGDPVQNPPLQHNDVIIMNRTFLARLTYGLNTFTQPFRDVLGFLLFFDSLSNSAENLFRP